ncbi:MAG: M1 family metallopeptidase [Pseudomonadota bacterium]
MHRTVISAAVLALALSSHPALAATTQLPRNVSPIHYDVAIAPDAKAGTFSGHVSISLTVLEATRTITLNAADLAFQNAHLVPIGGKGGILAGTPSVDANAQTASFTFAEPIAKGGYKLVLDYTGVIGTQASGLFSLDYDTPGGKKRALYTQFENSDARRMIPSWDEPNYKATFTLEATVPAGEMAVSNMPAAKTTALPDGRNLVNFGRSPKMSTYLLFFSLGDFERATAMADGTEVGVITTRGGAAQAAFALDASKQVLREYNDYFGVRYPLPKLDNIAAPGRSQFFGAMENWGAIFSFEYYLLLDPAISTQNDKQEIFSTAAHEIAHQWFGDLVTMQWWDDIWLNEGFASWMENRTMARLHPEWNTALGAVATRERAMNKDSLSTTHPVVQKIDTVEQASQAFDDITYQKGEAVIRMLENYVGADAWRKGVRSYMKANAYSNTVSGDLWKQIEKAAAKPVTAIARDFTMQPGIPLIRVESASCQGNVTQVALTQSEFSRDHQDKAPLAWQVPVVAKTLAGKEARTLVSGGKAGLNVPGCGPLVVNAGQNGYFRTLYTPALFAELAASFDKLAPIDQLGLLADSWALGLAGVESTSDFLDLVKGTPVAADPQVWGKIATVLDGIQVYYHGDEARRKTFASFAIARLAPVMAQVGWTARNGEAASVTNLRETMVDALGSLGDAATIAEARRRYASKDELPAALRKTIMGIVAQHADAASWDAMHAAALAEKTPLIKDQYYRLLATSDDVALAQRALDLAMTDEPGLTNSAAMLSAVAGLHPDLAFDYAIAHMEAVNKRVDVPSRSRFYPRLANGSSNPVMLDKLAAYAKANLAADARGDADTAAAGIRMRIQVRTERVPAIDAWLARNAH